MDLGHDLKALAYPAPNPSVAEPVSPCLCSLVFLCDGGKLATLLLVVSMPTAHSTTDSSFVLQYDGDNLIPNNIKLRSSRGCLRREELQDVSSVAGDVKTLMLSTKQSCSVWCPATTPEFHPKQGSELALQRLVDLARATSVHIVFDFSQLHPPYKSTFKAFSKAARGLAGFPVEALLSKQGLRKASGEVFAPTEIAGAPPAYDAARTRKRPRKGSSSPCPPPRSCTPTTPTARSYTTEKTVSVSPETEAAALRHAQVDYHTNVYINAIVEDRVAAHIEKLNASQAAAIDAAVAKRLDAYFSSPSHAERLDAAVHRQIDATVEARLPDAVQDVLVSADPPNSPTSSTYDTCGNHYPRLPPLTPAGKTFLPHLRTHLLDQFSLFQQQQHETFKKRISETYNDVAASAADDRIREQGEWEAEREEHSTELLLLRRDTLDELWLEGQKVLEAGHEQVAELTDQLGAELVERVGALVQQIEGLNGYCVRKIVAAEVARQWRRRGGVPKGFTKGFGRFLLTDPDPKLLGRKMRADMQWEDVSFSSSFGYSRPLVSKATTALA